VVRVSDRWPRLHRLIAGVDKADRAQGLRDIQTLHRPFVTLYGFVQ
jgi:hypothetical protein